MSSVDIRTETASCRLRRVFEIDITTCPDCGGRLRWIADITEPTVIRKIMLHVQSRAPPRDASPDEEDRKHKPPVRESG